MTTARGYTTLLDVTAAYAAEGVTLTDAQALLVGMNLPAVEAAIDAYTGRAWLLGAITDETVYPIQGVLWLQQRPVDTIEAVRQVAGLPPVTTTLTVDVDYTLIDAAQGRVGIVAGLGWGSEAWASGYILPALGSGQAWAGAAGYRYSVDYTPVETVPPLVAWAARETVKAWIAPAIGGVGEDVSRLTVWHQIDVTFDKSTPSTQAGRPILGELPTFVQARLRSLKASIV